MASPELDPSFFRQVVEWGWAFVVALVGLLYKGIQKQLDSRRKGEMVLHKRIADHEQHDNDRFERMMQQQSQNHFEVLRELGDLKRQIR